MLGRKRPFPVARIVKGATPAAYTRLLPKVRKVVASGVHSLAIAADGKLHTWGCHEEGQLGRGLHSLAHSST